MLWNGLVLVAAAGSAVFACGGLDPGSLPAMFRHGTVRGPNFIDRPVTLHIVCAKPDLAPRIELELTNADAHDAFDYDDFLAGSGAGGVALSNIEWHGATPTRLTAAANGRWESTDSFALDATGAEDQWLPMLWAMHDEPGTLVWTQTAFDNLDHRLVATFDFGASDEFVRQGLDYCLLPEMQAQPSALLR